MAMSISDLAFWTDPCCSPVSSPTFCPCLLDGAWNWLIPLPALRLLMGFLAMTTWVCPMLRPCRTAPCRGGHSLCWVSCGSWFVSTHGTALLTLLPNTAPAETEFMPCEKSPMRNTVKPFRVLEVNRGVIINLCKITGFCNAKVCNPGNRSSCIWLN